MTGSIIIFCFKINFSLKLTIPIECYTILRHQQPQGWPTPHYVCRHFQLWMSSINSLVPGRTGCHFENAFSLLCGVNWAPSQYPKRRLFVRSREVSKPRDRYFKLSYCFEIWQAHRQHCCRSACHISERSDKSKYKSRGFETLRDLTKRRLFGYWDGALVLACHISDFTHWPLRGRWSCNNKLAFQTHIKDR